MVLLENLTKEKTCWQRFFSRWAISDEPLRNDATHLLDRINANVLAPAGGKTSTKPQDV